MKIRVGPVATGAELKGRRGAWQHPPMFQVVAGILSIFLLLFLECYSSPNFYEKIDFLRSIFLASCLSSHPSPNFILYSFLQINFSHKIFESDTIFHKQFLSPVPSTIFHIFSHTILSHNIFHKYFHHRLSFRNTFTDTIIHT